MARQFRSDDAQRWFWGFGVGAPLDLTLGTETASWNGSTRFSAYGATTGTGGTKTLTNPGGWGHKGFHLIHQSRGTGAGAWEIQYIDWSLGSNQCMFPLQNSYTTGAQVVTLNNFPSYMPRNITVNGTFTPPAYNGTTGGIIALMCSGTLTVANGGSLNADGATGVTQSITGAGNTNQTSGGGFRGGYGQQTTGAYQGQQGESSLGNGTASSNANGMGGGGAYGNGSAGSSAGGGGGHATAGTAGSSGENTNGAAGGTDGVAALTSLFMGGGGGGCGSRDTVTQTIAAGGSGGGIIVIIAKTITLNGYILARGGAGGNGSRYGDGGGGAGGSILLKCNSASLGTSLVLATGGAGGSDRGGNGGNGRIHIDYKTSYTGSTTPTMDVRQDSTLNPFSMGGGAAMLL